MISNGTDALQENIMSHNIRNTKTRNLHFWGACKDLQNFQGKVLLTVETYK